MAQIVLLVDKEGQSQTIVKGVAGPSCKDKSAFLTSALGTVRENIHTEEYEGIQLFDTNNVQQNQPIRHVQKLNL